MQRSSLTLFISLAMASGATFAEKPEWLTKSEADLEQIKSSADVQKLSLEFESHEEKLNKLIEEKRQEAKKAKGKNQDKLKAELEKLEYEADELGEAKERLEDRKEQFEKEGNKAKSEVNKARAEAKKNANKAKQEAKMNAKELEKNRKEQHKDLSKELDRLSEQSKAQNEDKSKKWSDFWE